MHEELSGFNLSQGPLNNVLQYFFMWVEQFGVPLDLITAKPKFIKYL